jgi:tRNA threonylcarbamoyladenosine biosynthesis protein TsaE
MSVLIHLADTSATDQLGKILAAALSDRTVIYLHGDLGAGKSSLARALLRGLGVQGAIKSPTYTLIERYALESGEAVHLDLYRLSEASELDFLGLDELQVNARLWMIEWPERGEGHLPDPDLRIYLEVEGRGRKARMIAATRIGETLMAHVNQIVGA